MPIRPRRVPATPVIPRRELHRPGAIALALLAFLGLGALGGGVTLMLDPDGAAIGWDRSMLDGSPFGDFFVPGLILAGLFGVGSFGVVVGGLRGHPLAPFLAFAIGCAQMIWITVELAILGELSFLHPTMFAIGLAIAAAAVPWGWPTFVAWRRTRGVRGRPFVHAHPQSR